MSREKIILVPFPRTYYISPRSKEEIQSDDDYDDPDAKVILVSHENIHFRVPAWHLKKHR
ncbi:hypothetical protein M231_05973 [Tremella mesenterica]|uniref:Uncharacterized protein n=1 Tax=Tremella mesenterica TaxID=5217 RepID=A0A4Q1BGR4_TREME|nr:hypothetical protein M231_05973 [Tremella mesenterica]